MTLSNKALRRIKIAQAESSVTPEEDARIEDIKEVIADDLLQDGLGHILNYETDLSDAAQLKLVKAVLTAMQDQVDSMSAWGTLGV